MSKKQIGILSVVVGVILLVAVIWFLWPKDKIGSTKEQLTEQLVSTYNQDDSIEIFNVLHQGSYGFASFTASNDGLGYAIFDEDKDGNCVVTDSKIEYKVSYLMVPLATKKTLFFIAKDSRIKQILVKRDNGKVIADCNIDQNAPTAVVVKFKRNEPAYSVELLDKDGKQVNQL